jgi:hypothetical protein
MAAVVYIRVTNQNSSSIVTLLCSKTKASETSHDSSAGIISCSITCKTRETSPGHSRAARSPRIHMDRFITLAWIKSNRMRWKEFVGNRVSLIQETLSEAHWKFISGKKNISNHSSSIMVDRTCVAVSTARILAIKDTPRKSPRQPRTETSGLFHKTTSSLRRTRHLIAAMLQFIP